jgi:hypothetical protein
MQTQTWNSLIEYIKLRLGSPINQIELSDDDMQSYLSLHMIPEISQYISNKKFVRLSNTNLTPNADAALFERSYTIPMDDDNTEIIEVRNAYWEQTWGVGMTANSVVPINPVDHAMLNEITDIARTQMPLLTFEFIRPDTLILDEDLDDDVILELRVLHKDLTTIPSDVYHDIVKPMALGQICLLIASFRSKYESITTPFGAVNLNWQMMEDKGNTLLQQVQEKLDMMPTDHLVHLF